MVSSTWKAGTLLCCVSLGLAAPPKPRNQISYRAHDDRTAAIANTFQIAWDGYHEYAWGYDSLLPVSMTGTNDRNGWGASAIDALSTALIMGNQEVVNQILEYVPTINYNVTSDSVSLFETTIRYLGGMLSAHDFLTGPLSGLSHNKTQVNALLEQSVNLANNLKVAFTTPVGLPMNDIYFDPPRLGDETTNGLATIGTLVLEWTRLSDKTGDPSYGAAAQKGESYLLNPQPVSVGEPWPGLLGSDVYISNGTFEDSGGGWVGGDDSFYEYLIKMYVYDPSRFSHYKDRWVLAVESSIEYLSSHPTTNKDLTYLAMYNGRNELVFVSEHLACFDGGSFILGGLTLNNQKYIDFGLALVDACYNTYAQDATGIGPEVFAWQDSKTPLTASNNPAPPSDQAAFYEKAGFWITSSDYVLRPEVIESIYYAYRATGDSKYQDWAWNAYLSINKTCAVGAGYSDITDVNAPGGGSFSDKQESFFFAEVLKYCYLIQAADAPWQVSATHDNQFVFNTEAHPMKVAGRPI